MRARTLALTCLVVTLLAVNLVGGGATLHGMAAGNWQASPTPVRSPDQPPITPDTADQVVQLAMLGRGRVYDLRWLPDQSTLAVVTSAGIWMFDTLNLDTPPRFLAIRTGGLSAMTLSPDGAVLASSGRDVEGFFVKLWDTQTGLELARLAGHDDLIMRVTFSPDGTMLASGDDEGVVRLWHVDTFDASFVLEGHSDEISGLAFDSTGSTLATTSMDGTVRMWDVGTGTGRVFFDREEETISGLSSIGGMPTPAPIMGSTFGPNDNTLAVWSDGGLSIMDTQTGEPVAEWDGRYLCFACVAFSQSNSLIAARDTSHQTIHLWHPDDRLEEKTLHVSGYAYIVSFSPDGSLLAAADNNGAISVWRVESGALLGELTGFTSQVYDATLGPDGSLLAAGYADDTVRLWDVAQLTQQAILSGHVFPVNGVTFSPDGSLLASASSGNPFGTEAGSVRLWDIASRTSLAVLELGSDAANAVFSPDGSTLAYPTITITDRIIYGIRLWNMKSQLGQSFEPGHTETIVCVAFSPDGNLLASGGWDGAVRVWNIDANELFLTIHPPETNAFGGSFHAVTGVVFSPDGTLLAAAGMDGTIQLWHIPEKRLVTTFETGGRQTYHMAFSPDGALLATPGEDFDGNVLIWDVATGNRRATLTGHNGFVYSAAFSADGTLLASAGEDGTVRLWGLPSDTR